MPSKKPAIILINGSLHGDSENSNTISLLRLAEDALLEKDAQVTLISPELIKFPAGRFKNEQSIYVLSTPNILSALKTADGLIVGTGTYWGQSSSTLQRFIEEVTPTEGTRTWLGKPMGIIVSELSTGGQTVLSNLMLTFSNLGCLIPPQAGMVLSRLGQQAQKHGDKWANDAWCQEDVETLCENVIKYARHRNAFRLKSWPVDREPNSFHKVWVELPGQKRF